MGNRNPYIPLMLSPTGVFLVLCTLTEERKEKIKVKTEQEQRNLETSKPPNLLTYEPANRNIFYAPNDLPEVAACTSDEQLAKEVRDFLRETDSPAASNMHQVGRVLTPRSRRFALLCLPARRPFAAAARFFRSMTLEYACQAFEPLHPLLVLQSNIGNTHAKHMGLITALTTI